MKTLQFVISVLVSAAMMIILATEDKNQIVIRWLAAGVGFASLAFQLLLYFTKNPKKNDSDEFHPKSSTGL